MSNRTAVVEREWVGVRVLVAWVEVEEVERPSS
jgi:hypothetical protein